MADIPTPPSPVSEADAVRLLLRLAEAVDQTGQVLEVVTDLHRRLADLHATLTDPVIDLERLLRNAREGAPNA